ncbi:retrovirus-related pol polyprotein from transposon TNT 1-94 [Tanacetum coccineum]|uniref:Retrovirus-related pol polyprotein from transposon TNT 1-94 n=1 Tax=Tanacetum coccineum TaxID=301880 RepID=A0ABQ5I4S8_9ASTR
MNGMKKMCQLMTMKWLNLMALADDENVNVGKESARNGEWVKISMSKTEILKENQNMKKELKELTATTETSLNSSNKVNQYLVVVKSLVEDTKVSILVVERPWLSEAKGFNLPNHDTGRILPAESQLKVTNSLGIFTDSSITDYDLADESLVYSTLLPLLERLASASKNNSAPTGKLKNLKTNDDIPLRGEALQAKKSKSSNANRFKTPTKRLAHLNIKTINQLAKQNLVLGLPSLVYSKEKPCPSCVKGKHHRASFKTKKTSSIKKCLHILHMDLFRHVTPKTINHEKYTLVIVDEYSSYTWVYFLKKKSHAPETIMSFIKRVENQNDIKFKQLRTDNGTEFKNSIPVNFCDEKRISQNFSSPYTPKQNGVAKRKNRTLQDARTMLSGSVFSK